MKITPSFHAQHSPMGAHSSFTLGMFGAVGGFALEKGGPAENGTFIGYKTASGKLHYLPFFAEITNDMERYTLDDMKNQTNTVIYGESDIERDYQWATDSFKAPNIDFKITTPFFAIPDPATASLEELKFASCPAVFLSLTLTNDSDEDWEGFFGLQTQKYWSALNGAPGQKGFTSRNELGFVTSDSESQPFCDFTVERALSGEHTQKNFLLGSIAGVHFAVPAGTTKTLEVVVGGYISGNATFNRPTRYAYTNYFSGLQEVFSFAQENLGRYMEEAATRDAELAASPLSEDQKFLIAHATRSYYGSTEWLTDGDRPIWVVNEGEYLMMNTLDLTVDMLFFELRFNPWTVRNVLEFFVENYSYIDEVFSPDDTAKLYPGGISFTHDMGVANTFSPVGYSSYESSGLDRKCFSYMTCEQLTNWVLCAGAYMAKTGDSEFLKKHQPVFIQCLESLLNRDNPDPEKRNGLMNMESSRTKGGGEITTYDSLDHSLGQARNNVYLAGKCWASYLALEQMLNQLDESGLAAEAHQGAVRCADSLEKAFDSTLGFIPAVLEFGNESAIIPAAEALVYPWEMGLKDAVSLDGEFGSYIRMLKRHLENILKPGVCLYDDGGWKLSSSADNSWMSKICLNQYVAREILGIQYDGEERADAAHVQWEVEGSKFYACSDQFASGIPKGSLYYPRIVTNILWMNE
ncbi:glycoside hydrolase family 52 protein [Pontiellaceae bacterium B1224]|nr:glycoside hydrolase family 52 protein [Pontiellaceae bacterium B1224]